jgi:hypothetical protein
MIRWMNGWNTQCGIFSFQQEFAECIEKWIVLHVYDIGNSLHHGFSKCSRNAKGSPVSQELFQIWLLT